MRLLKQRGFKLTRARKPHRSFLLQKRKNKWKKEADIHRIHQRLNDSHPRSRLPLFAAGLPSFVTAPAASRRAWGRVTPSGVRGRGSNRAVCSHLGAPIITMRPGGGGVSCIIDRKTPQTGRLVHYQDRGRVGKLAGQLVLFWGFTHDIYWASHSFTTSPQRRSSPQLGKSFTLSSRDFWSRAKTKYRSIYLKKIKRYIWVRFQMRKYNVTVWKLRFGRWWKLVLWLWSEFLLSVGPWTHRVQSDQNQICLTASGEDERRSLVKLLNFFSVSI